MSPLLASGPLIRKKALLYNEKLGGPSTFQASNGWIQRFKTRHRIHEISRKGEKVSGDVGASCSFAAEFSKIIAEGGYRLDNIYNADETGLAWKSLPRRISDAQDENERDVERVTVLACANASGTHRIPLLVIGKSQNPKCLRNAKTLPVNYCGERNACIDRQIFSDWYRTIFLTAIKERNGRRGEKFLLLLDNTPSHPSAEDLNCIDESCRVVILPPNVSALIQPMDQGVIETTKKDYKKSLIRQLLLEEEDVDEEDAAANFLKRWNMLDCCELIAQAWDDLSDATLCNAWKKIFFANNIRAEVSVVKDRELTHLINRIPGYENFTDEETTAWLQVDSLKNMPVWHIMDDDEILNFDEPAQTLIRSRLHGSQEHDDDDHKSTKDAPATREVLKSMSTVLRWYRTRRVVDAEHLATLTKIRQLIEDSILEP